MSFSALSLTGRLDPERDVVVITGGSSGLGASLVREFLARGCRHVVSLDVVAGQAEACDYIECDISDAAQVSRAAQDIRSRHGDCTVLINNAAVQSAQLVAEASLQEVHRVLDVNLYGLFATTRQFLPAMLALNRGYVVTIASVLGYAAPARLSAYGASKAGAIAFHEALTYELKPHDGVSTLLVCPGQMSTPLFCSVATPSAWLAPVLDPDHVAARVVAAMGAGRTAPLSLPCYARFMPFFRVLPGPLASLARSFSKMDHAMS
ncbi:uncharacterized oxidoreductase Tda5p [Trichomonascus vanleenenianus]|uniref:SDR family oxidoreductase n=1 Tax=Trichomonascus vanleenenianus TaxID=2268995 RepID=UPI003EC96A99